MELLIGCPVRKREWVLPTWFDHVFAACEYAGIEPGFIFGADLKDTPTCEVLVERTRGSESVVVPLDDQQREDIRDWGPHRLLHMVTIRNKILEQVRQISPRWYLSLDSDVLLHEAALFNVIESSIQREWQAVGGKVFMSQKGIKWPSYGMYTSQGRIRRAASDGVHPVDVIMAMKLMESAAYNVDYKYHSCGEDVGWSLMARKAGVSIGWDGRVASKHILIPKMLDVPDPRVGF